MYKRQQLAIGDTDNSEMIIIQTNFAIDMANETFHCLKCVYTWYISQKQREIKIDQPHLYHCSCVWNSNEGNEILMNVNWFQKQRREWKF